jgi:hypothetical protein
VAAEPVGLETEPYRLVLDSLPGLTFSFSRCRAGLRRTTCTVTGWAAPKFERSSRRGNPNTCPCLQRTAFAANRNKSCGSSHLVIGIHPGRRCRGGGGGGFTSHRSVERVRQNGKQARGPPPRPCTHRPPEMERRELLSLPLTALFRCYWFTSPGERVADCVSRWQTVPCQLIPGSVGSTTFRVDWIPRRASTANQQGNNRCDKRRACRGATKAWL